MTKDKWENTVWDTDVYLDDIDKEEARMNIVKAPPKPNPLPMTEQEWLQTCDTEQLAEALWEIYQAGKNDFETHDTFEFFIDKEDAVVWLKEIHDEMP